MRFFRSTRQLAKESAIVMRLVTLLLFVVTFCLVLVNPPRQVAPTALAQCTDGGGDNGGGCQNVCCVTYCQLECDWCDGSYCGGCDFWCWDSWCDCC